AWKLALVQRGQAKADALLDSYSIERSTIGDQVLHGAEKVTTIATLRNRFAQYMRNHVAAVVASFGFVQDKIANALCELNINYRKGPLSVDEWHGHAGSVKAGDRLPDAPLSSLTGGNKSTVFAVTQGTRHTLLLLPGSNDAEAIAHLEKI